MAIKIPSKNIYEIDNPKVRDNLVNNVNVEQTVVSQNNEYEVVVHGEEYNNISDIIDKPVKNIKIASTGRSTNEVIHDQTVWFAIAEITNQKVYTCHAEIDILQKNKYITKVLYEKNKDDENQIQYTVYGNIRRGTCKRTVKWDMPLEFDQSIFTPEIEEVSEVTFNDDLEVVEEGVRFDYTSDIISKFTGKPSNGYWEEQTVTATLKPIDVSYVSYYDETADLFIVDFEAMSNIIVVRVGGIQSTEFTSETATLNGEYEVYEPTQIELTVYGNTTGIDLTDGTVTYGSGNKPHSLTANELLQDSGKVKTKDESGNDIQLPITEYLANNVLKQYAVGKETATLLCDINEYYDENGDLKISTEKSGLPMTFNIGDEVIPYVFGANGQDKPMSLYRDGNPKVFRIIGTNTIYDGAVWQELTLQEVTKG